MKIALITDAWHPQVNGVVRTLTAITGELTRRGHRVQIIAPDQFRSLPCPTYPEIRLALAGRRAVAKRLDAFAPDAIHIATEGPLGLAARRHCRLSGRPFTTAYHTHFPEYLARRTGLNAKLFWPFIRWFHGCSDAVMVATESVRAELRAQGVTQLAHWGRGVDLSLFRPGIAPPDVFFGLPRPIQLYVGRVAVEKNVEAFLANTHPGSKVVVGDGPALAGLEQQFPGGPFPRPPVGSRPCRVLCRGGRLRVSEPHRHIRPGDDRGAGLRHSGCSIPRHRSARHIDEPLRRNGGAAGRCDRRGAAPLAGRLRPPCRIARLGGQHRPVPRGPGACTDPPGNELRRHPRDRLNRFSLLLGRQKPT